MIFSLNFFYWFKPDSISVIKWNWVQLIQYQLVTSGVNWLNGKNIFFGYKLKVKREIE